MSCKNNGSINKTFIIEPLSITGGSPTLSACTTLYTNLVKSCSGDTSISLGTGLVTISGNTNIFGNLTATTIEATTFLSGGTNILDIINANDTFVTGGTFSDFTDSISMTRNDGANIVITGLTNFFTTGATLINDTVYFDRNDILSAFTLDLSTIDLNDTFVTGFTYDDNNNLTVTRNDGTQISTTIDTMSGLTINGILNVSGDSNLGNISGDSISINGGEVMTRIPSSLDFQLFGNQSSTGVIYFEGLSANTIDNSKFDLGPTKGWIVDNTTNPSNPSVQYINYSGSSGSNPSGITLTYLATNPVTYIGMTGGTTGGIVQSTTPFTHASHRDTLILGVVVHSNNTIVNVTNNIPALGIDPTMQLYDLIVGLGQFNLNDGGNTSNIYSANGSNLNINKTSGDIFSHSANYENDPKNPHIKDIPSGTSITFRYRISDSTEWSNTTEINPNIYETGGTTAATPSNKYTIQRIIIFPSGISRLQYGQNTYDSLDDAEASISSEEFIIENNIKENGLLRGFIILREGTTDLSNGDFARFVAANHFGHANDTVVGNVHRTEILNNSSTGLRTGGFMIAASPTTFSISSGSGIIIDNTTNPLIPVRDEVTWDAITGITLTNLTGSVGTFIMIDSSGSVNQFTLESPPNQTDKRDKILLGAITHSNNTNITNLFNSPIHITSPINQHEDLTSSIGSFSVNGNHIKSIPGTIELEKTAGFSYFYGGNFQTDNTNPSVLSTILTSGSTTPLNPLVYATGTNILGLSGYSIDTDNYDPNGLGVITAANNNKYVAHRIWHIPINNLLVFQYGQQQYNSLNLAIDGFSTESFVEPAGLSLGSYLISVVITKKGETDLSDLNTTKFIQQGKFAGSGGGGGSIADTLQTAYENSTQPEIITDSTRGAVDFRVGSGSDSDKLVTFQNTVGDIKSWINGNGDALFSAMTATTIVATTYYGDGSNLTGIDNFYTTGATKIGDDVYFDRTDSLSAYSFTLTGISTTDYFVTGGTFSGNQLTLTRNDNISMLITGFTGSDTYTTGSTLIGDIAYFDTIGNLSAYTLDLSSLSVSATTDNFTTGVTLNGNILSFDRNDTLNAYTVDLSSIVTSGGTSSGGTDTIRFTGSRAKANQSNLFLRHNDGSPFNIIPYRTYLDGTITKIVASGRDLDTWEARILTGTTVATDTIYTLGLNLESYKFDNPNVSVASGTTLYLYASGTSIAYPTIDVYFRKD